MSERTLRLSAPERARISLRFLDEIRRKAGVLAGVRAAAALAGPATLRRQALLRDVGGAPILFTAVGAVAVYKALSRSLGPHRALGTVRSAVLAAAAGIRLPLPGGAAQADPLDALAEALEATLAAGQELDLYEVRWLDGPPGTVQFEVLRCRIHETCHALGTPEVTTCFCDAEAPVLTRGDPQLVLIRDATIARGHPLCRFTFHVVESLAARRERLQAATK